MQLFLLSEKFFEELYAEVLTGLADKEIGTTIFEHITARLAIDDENQIRIQGANYALGELAKKQAVMFAVGVLLGQYMARRQIYLLLEDSDGEPTKH